MARRSDYYPPHSSGGQMGSQTDDNTLSLFDKLKPEVYRDLYVSGQNLRHVAFNNLGSKMCCIQMDSNIRIWTTDKPDVKSSVEIRNAHERMVESVSWNPWNAMQLVSCGSHDQTLKLWDTKTKTKLKQFRTQQPNYIVRYSNDGKYIAIGTKDGVRVVNGNLQDVNELQEVGFLRERPDDIYDIAWSNSSQIFCVALGTGSVRVCRVIPEEEDSGAGGNSSGERVKVVVTLRGHRTAANTITFDPKGKYLAVGTNEGIVSLWNVHEWICEKTLSMFDLAIMCMSFSHDGNYLAVATDTNSPIELVHVDSGTVVKTIKRQNYTLNPSLAWSPHRLALAATGDQHGLTLYKN